MKRVFLLSAFLLITVVSSATAQRPGINLSWDDCNASLGISVNKTSTCQSNTDAAKIFYGSYVLPSDVQALAGNDIVLDICTNSATLPCWWNFTVAPRQSGYDVRYDSPCQDANEVGIYDYWSTIPGGATGSFTATLLPTNAVPIIRITATGAINGNLAQPVAASVGEIYSFTFRLSHDATVGAGCNGCLVAAYLVLKQVRVTQVGFPTIELTTPSSRNHVYWQGGPLNNQCIPDPVMDRTWGSVKALYR